MKKIFTLSALILGSFFFSTSAQAALLPITTIQPAQLKFCSLLDTQKKDQLTKFAAGKKIILDKEAKNSDALAKRNIAFIANATTTLATQEADVALLLADLSSIATTDVEKNIVAEIEATTSAALLAKEASTTETLANFSKTVTDASKGRADFVIATLDTYEHAITAAFDVASQNCIGNLSATTINTKLDVSVKAARNDLQKNEVQAKATADTVEGAYTEAKLELNTYDKTFSNVLAGVKDTIKKTFTEE